MGGRLPEVIADAFGLGRPTSDLVPHSYSSMPTWTLDTTNGRVLVKQVRSDGPSHDLAEAMAFEQQALEAGIGMPEPIAPVTPLFGQVTEVEGLGLLRAHGWIDGRPLTAADDVAEWVGLTLARLHALLALDQAEPQWYGLHSQRQWQAWLAEGLERDRAWAPVLERRLGDVLEASAWIGQAFEDAGDYVMTHRDVEPWNILITSAGPVLVDWDTAGPDSAGLEVAQVAAVFAGRDGSGLDVDAVRRTVLGYELHGGRQVDRGPNALARRAGMRLNRLSERLRISLGQQAPGSADPVQVEARATEQLDELPEFLDALARWPLLWVDGT